jgi:hypothetical protein
VAFPNDVLQTPGGNVALQTVSLIFNATGLASGALRPPFKPIIGNLQPGAIDPTTGKSLLAISMIDALTLDVTIQETHTANAEITEHPVEQGADITDHVRPKPVELRMEGIITDTPIDDSLIASVTRSVPGLGLGVATYGVVKSLLAGASLARSAFDRLRQFRDNGTPVGIFTPYRSYSNMVMDSLVVTRDKDTGEALHFVATFREVLFVTSGVATITLPPAAQAAKDMGTQGTPTASGKLTKTVSTMYNGINTGTGGGLDAFKAWEGGQ